jgi:hypothetical protein
VEGGGLCVSTVFVNNVLQGKYQLQDDVNVKYLKGSLKHTQSLCGLDTGTSGMLH